MASTPRSTVDDGYTRGLSCAICGLPELFVQHLADYPDFVTCNHCGAAFVVEEAGERVLYGKIPESYPGTAEFALKQWVWLEAVDRRAQSERPSTEPAPADDLPEEEPIPQPLPEAQDAWITEAEDEPAEPEPEEAPSEPDVGWLASRLRAGGLPAGVPIPTEPEPYRPSAGAVPLSDEAGPAKDTLPAWLREEEPPDVAPQPAPVLPSPPPPQVPPLAAAPATPIAAPEGEPPAGTRHRVVIRGDRVLMPINACAHCRRSPVPDRLPVPGSLPRRDDPARHRATTFQIPLCRECSQRAAQRSGEQRNAVVMAHLTGALVGLVVVVGLLAAGLVPFTSGLAIGLAILGGAWLLGYLVTAVMLLGRTRRLAPPPDAAFVRSTLRVAVQGPGQTAFDWRNPETAANFVQANSAAAAGDATAIPEAEPPT